MSVYIEFFKELQSIDYTHSNTYIRARCDAVVWFLLLTKEEKQELIDELYSDLDADELTTAASVMVNRFNVPIDKKIIEYDFGNDAITLMTKIIMLTEHS